MIDPALPHENCTAAGTFVLERAGHGFLIFYLLLMIGRNTVRTFDSKRAIGAGEARSLGSIIAIMKFQGA